MPPPGRLRRRLPLPPASAFAGVALAAVLAASGSGCHQEMLRATPWGSLEPKDGAATASSERIALWPLFYRRAPATSILWPIIEWTEDSWALRPLFAKYGPRADLLWPLIHVDAEARSGYFLPLAGMAFVENGYFLTPLAGMGKRGPESGWFYSPLYFDSWERNSRVRVIPPLLTSWGHETERRGWFASPLYLQSRDAEDIKRFIPPLLTGWGSAGPDHAWFGSPLFIHSLSGNSRTGVSRTVAIPILLSGWSSSPEASLVVSPLYGQGRAPATGSWSFATPLLSWWTREPEGGWSVDVLLSLFGMTRTPIRSSEHLFPLYWRGRKEGPDDRVAASWWALVPFYVHVEGKRGRRFDASPLLLSGKESSPSGSSWHLLLSLIAWGETPARDDYSGSRFSRFLPFYLYARNPTSTSFGLPFLLYWHELGTGGSVTVRYLAFLGGFDSGEGRRSSYFFPLYRHQYREPEAAPRVDGRPQAPAPVSESDFSLLVFLYDRVERRFADGGPYRRQRVLWRLYHDEIDGDRRAVDVFPFVTYDREGSTALSWSWLWRFIRYARRGEEKAMYFLFLPVARWGAKPPPPPGT
jgi:hypothetical protein